MSSVVNSTAAFDAVLVEVGLAVLIPKFRAEGWDCFGDFGFACSNPMDPEALQKDIITKLLGQEPGAEAPEIEKKAWDEKRRMIPKIRRVFAQSHSVAEAESQKLVSTEPEQVVKLHPAEREKRRDSLCRRITGFTLSGPLDPSARLIDLCSSIVQTGQVRYIEWAKCSTHRSELVNVQEVVGLSLNEKGLLVRCSEPDGPPAELGTDLLLDQALRRRALAADMADLCTYETMQLWHSTLLESISTEAPPGYSKTSYVQIANADKELWNLVSAACRSGCRRPSPLEPSLFEKAFKENMFGLRLQLMLAPLPSRGSALASSSAGSSSDVARLQSTIQNLRNEVSGLKRKAPSNEEGGKGRGKGNKKGKDFGQGAKKPSLPKDLKGLQGRTSGGDPICFSYNRKGCKDAPAGARCKFGMHVCMTPGCQQNHPVSQCPLASR